MKQPLSMKFWVLASITLLLLFSGGVFSLVLSHPFVSETDLAAQFRRHVHVEPAQIHDIPWYLEAAQQLKIIPAKLERTFGIWLPSEGLTPEVNQLLSRSGLISLDAKGSHFNDTQFESLVGLDSLCYIALDQTEITDNCVGCINRIPQLEYLTLCDTKISDAGVEQFRPNVQMDTLDLSRTAITDLAIDRISRVYPNLRKLNLSGTRITDKSLDYLGRLKVLSNLYLSDTRLTASARLKNVRLRHLSVAKTLVGDQFVMHLSSELTLHSLDLSGTKVGATGYESLVRIPDLQVVHVRGLSSQQRAVLLRVKPSLKVLPE